MNIVKYVSLSLICIFLMSYAQIANAKTYAYIIGVDGKATKINADTNTIIDTKDLPNSGGYVQSGKTSVVADPINKHLFAVVGPKGSKVLVYNLSTLNLLKDLGIYTPEPDITIFSTPDGRRVFVVWWNPKLEGGAWQFDVFDGITLEKLKTLDLYFYAKQVTFSKDSSMLYAIEGGDEAKIKVIDMATLKLISTIDLNTIWKTNGFAPGIEDYKDEKILIRETKTIAEGELPEVTYFVYDLKNKTASTRIVTSFAGSTNISPDGSKIFIHDEEPIESARGIVQYYKSSGHLYIYDVATGKKIGYVQFSVDKSSDILGIHPAGNKVYMIGNIQGTKSLIGMDIVNFKILKTLSISKNALFMVFYSE